MSPALEALFFASVLLSSVSVMPFVFAQNTTLIPPPLHQLKNGISAYDVKCKQTLELVIKKSDHSPACVKPQTAQRLVERGWETIIANQTKTLDGSGIINTGNIVSSTKPDVIKILAIDMSPNPLKVGDDVGFTVTFKNVSSKPILVSSGCGPSPVSYTISPASYVKQFPAITHELGCAAQVGPLAPNQTFTADAIAVGGYYQIIKAGNLNVNITVRSALVTGNWPQSANLTDFTTKIQFNVTATNKTSSG